MKKYVGLMASFFLFQMGWASKGKVVVIGASSGIGREVARVFCHNGYQVAGVARNELALQSLREELGENFSFKTADIRSDEARQTIKDLIIQLGGCDIFVMNAGIWDDSRTEVSAPALAAYDWDKLLIDQLATIETNIVGFTRMAAVAFEYFIQQRRGHFVGVSSVDAVRGNPVAPVYSGTKAFESTYMQGMRAAFEQTGFHITVTDIRPGFVATYEIDKNDAFWVESVEDAGKGIFNAVMNKEKIAYIRARWGLFAGYLSLAPDSLYNYISTAFGIRSPDGFYEE